MKKSIIAVLMLVANAVSACTSVQTFESGLNEKASLYSTVGVASVTHCKGPAHVEYMEYEDGRRETKVTCYGEMVRSESSGFTGWDTLDSVLTGVISWITFGAIKL